LGSDLFGRRGDPALPVAPLAERLRPRTLDEVVGQRHLLGPGAPLRVAFESGKPHSMILWGPPGSGKTTLARLMAQVFDAEFISLSAVLSGVKDIRDAVQAAEHTLSTSGRRTILFVDEVHRFNKAQQDAFLPYVERGLFTFVGATTENPSFEVNSALLSRATVYVLESLSEADLSVLLSRTEIPFDETAKARLIGFADGDARRLLNAIEILINAKPEGAIDGKFVEDTLAKNLRRFDKGGEQFYDQISALHKAVRGSVEDVGLADPRALRIALDAAETFERLGSPEGELALAEAVIYMAVAAKSNATYLAYNAARAFVREDGTRPVPLHIRNAPTRLMKDLGYGKDYRYAHDEADAFAAGEDYFPEGMPAVSWYRPSERGLEGRIREKLDELRRRNEAAGRKRK
jgi:putative ATPase